MRKMLIIAAAILVVATVFSGAGVKTYVIHIRGEGIPACDIEFSPDRGEVFLLNFAYGGDLVKFAEKRFMGNIKECLRSLNPMIIDSIEKLGEEVGRECVEPDAEISDGVFTYYEGEDGEVLDKEGIYREIAENFGEEVRVSGKVIKIFRKERGSEIRERTAIISEFSTKFGGSSGNRVSNIELAARKLNNLKVLAGERLSFNEVVGERTEENGFREAKVIKDGEFVQGVGGGVCQVSTTLFNAWLMAGLDFETAAAHSLPVGYVGASLDAMVSEGVDLVLKNSGETPVYLYVRTEGERLVVTVYGKPSGFEIRLRSEVLERLPGEYERQVKSDLDWGEDETERTVKYAVDGLKSESYRDYYEGGKIVKSTRLRKNTYKPQNGLKYIRPVEETPDDLKNETLNIKFYR